MPGPWKVQIELVDLERKEARITATRTDGEDVQTYAIKSAIIETQAQKLAAMDHIWALHEADNEKRAQIAEVIGQLESQAEANLNAREAV